MYLAYEALGLPQESQDALFVLSKNYPQYVTGDRGDQRLAPGVLYDEGETLAGILTLVLGSAPTLPTVYLLSAN